jgi:hypothetical protein
VRVLSFAQAKGEQAKARYREIQVTGDLRKRDGLSRKSLVVFFGDSKVQHLLVIGKELPPLMTTFF